MWKYNPKALRKLLRARGLGVPAFAASTGLQRMTVSYIERGLTAPRADTLGKLASGLGVSVEAFYTHRDGRAT